MMSREEACADFVRHRLDLQNKVYVAKRMKKLAKWIILFGLLVMLYAAATLNIQMASICFVGLAVSYEAIDFAKIDERMVSKFLGDSMNITSAILQEPKGCLLIFNKERKSG